MAADIKKLLDLVIRVDGSDLHLSVGIQPRLRVHGRMRNVDIPVLTPDDTMEMMKAIAPQRNLLEFKEKGTTDFAYDYSGAARFRTSCYRQRGMVGLALRLLPNRILTFEQLGLPEQVRDLLHRPRGLLLVTGPTGSGKTTTLATMLDYLNRTFDHHIVTIEDPIEYYHKSDKSIITQREIGSDVGTFPEAMRRVLRMDPDVVLLGEMRDRETISTAITAAETGHLVLATLHTTGSARTVDRIIDQFPPDQQEQIRVQLSVSIIAVISQVLMPRADEAGRIAAFEIMIMNSAIENHIRKSESYKITSSIQTNRNRGMILLDEFLRRIYKEGKISREETILKAQNPIELKKRIDYMTLGGDEDGAESGEDAKDGKDAKNGLFGEEVVQMSAAGTKKLLGQILKELRVCHEGMIQEALSIQQKEGGQIGQILIRLGHLTESDLLKALGVQAGMEVVDLDSERIDPAAVKKIDYNMASMFMIVPYRFNEAGDLVVAMANPMNLAVLDDVRFMSNANVVGAVADEDMIRRTIEQYFDEKGDAATRFQKEQAPPELQPVSSSDGPVDLSDSEAMAQSAPVIKLLNHVLAQAIRDQAADIHLEPFEEDFKIRYRVDGVLYELDPPPKHLASALISRVKVMAGLDISETRLPQDGRIELAISGRPVDLRVSTLPTMFGESCVMRILDRSVVQLDMKQLGLRDVEIEMMRSLIRMPHGIILVTGPTGSGKTTTLYSALREANDVSRKIITTEDPVEYDLEGIMQVQVNEDIDVTFAACLRSILRQDPDMILIGEIRDKETAEMAIQSALTGHVVFSTLHTNDAPLAVTRLVDMGVEPFLVSASLEAVVAQRLVRKICTKCKTYYEPGDDVLMELELSPDKVTGKKFAFGKGCSECHYTGYKGRTGLFEMMTVTERVRQLIMDNVPTSRIRDAALEEGMSTLRESGLLAIFDGVTTIEEVVRETIATM